MSTEDHDSQGGKDQSEGQDSLEYEVVSDGQENPEPTAGPENQEFSNDDGERRQRVINWHFLGWRGWAGIGVIVGVIGVVVAIIIGLVTLLRQPGH